LNAFGGIVYREMRNIVLEDYEGYEGLLKDSIRYLMANHIQ